MTDPIRQYIDTHIPENHRQGDGCWDAAQGAMDELEQRQRLDVHEGEPHEFRTECLRCGLPGMLHVSLITRNEVVKIEEAPR